MSHGSGAVDWEQVLLDNRRHERERVLAAFEKWRKWNFENFEDCSGEFVQALRADQCDALIAKLRAEHKCGGKP